MLGRKSRLLTAGRIACSWAMLQMLGVVPVQAETARQLTRPEQRRIQVRSVESFPPTRTAPGMAPATVIAPRESVEVWQLSLDEAVQIALDNAEVIRVLAGNTAVASGATGYDPAIINNEVDRARARFDPTLDSQNTWGQQQLPQAMIVPGVPPQVEIHGIETDSYQSVTGVNKNLITGGRVGANVRVDQYRDRSGASLLLPETASRAELSVTQPLLLGAGRDVNAAPIIIARIDTERSYFQMKDDVQELVRGVIEAYWNFVFARTDTWARRQQVEQGQQALLQAEARMQVGSANITEVAQARASFETFRANLIASQAQLLQQESVLRNLLGLSPADRRHIEPTTPLSAQRLSFDWERMIATAERNRPDLIELKLILEADEQRLLVSRNSTRPQLDAVALYRWNGLEGRTPQGQLIRNEYGLADWQVGVNFSVPLGLRAGRAQLRQSELILERDRANLDQGVHNMTHRLADSYRNVATYYEQYLAYQRVREAARDNLERQFAVYGIGGIEAAGGTTIFLNLLQAITEWGNAASSESQYLALYNTELANLQREMGIILETHGVRFAEERFRSIGPLGHHFAEVCYPEKITPGPNTPQYSVAVPKLPEPPLENVDGTPPQSDQQQLYGNVIFPLPQAEQLPVVEPLPAPSR